MDGMDTIKTGDNAKGTVGEWSSFRIPLFRETALGFDVLFDFFLRIQMRFGAERRLPAVVQGICIYGVTRKYGAPKASRPRTKRLRRLNPELLGGSHGI